MESSVLDQLRLQEGRLFQSESVLALYLDVKAVINETLAASESAEKRASLTLLNDDYLNDLETMLKILAPKGVPEYHAQSLNECVKTVARLLWPTEHLLVARPSLSQLFKGLLKRITHNENFIHFKVLDPIKQDYVIREAFRRTLVNDCLIVFPSELDEHDSASQAPKEDREEVMSLALKEETMSINSFQRPAGARSTLGTSEIRRSNAIVSEKEFSKALSVAPSVALSKAPSIAPSKAPSVAPSKAPSVAPSVLKAKLQSDFGQFDEVVACVDSKPEETAKQDSSGSAILVDLKTLMQEKNKVDSLSVKEFRPREGPEVQGPPHSVVHSVMPKVTSAPECHKSVKSHMSAASYNTTATLHKPLNVRKVILEEEK